jgi:hypothetical protein
MKRPMFRNKIELATLILVLSAGCSPSIPSSVDTGERVASGESSQPSQGPAVVTETRPPAAGATEKAPGMIIHIDPNTGEILSKPPATPLPADKSTAGTQKELREVPSPVPGGGVMIEIDDRFKTPLKATVEPDGKVTIRHQSETSSSGEKSKN